MPRETSGVIDLILTITIGIRPIPARKSIPKPMTVRCETNGDVPMSAKKRSETKRELSADTSKNAKLKRTFSSMKSHFPSKNIRKKSNDSEV